MCSPVRGSCRSDLYQSLVRRPVSDPDDVEVLETIERDIHRTFPLHAMFSEVGGPGQTVLLRVLRAYAQYDRRVRAHKTLTNSPNPSPGPGPSPFSHHSDALGGRLPPPPACLCGCHGCTIASLLAHTPLFSFSPPAFSSARGAVLGVCVFAHTHHLAVVGVKGGSVAGCRSHARCAPHYSTPRSAVVCANCQAQWCAWALVHVRTCVHDANLVVGLARLFGTVPCGRRLRARCVCPHAGPGRRIGQVGYCQGMGFITAMFLSYLAEEDAFFLLLSIMNFPPHSLTGLFSPGLPMVRILEYKLQVCVSLWPRAMFVGRWVHGRGAFFFALAGAPAATPLLHGMARV
jgi:hypothetical protein